MASLLDEIKRNQIELHRLKINSGIVKIRSLLKSEIEKAPNSHVFHIDVEIEKEYKKDILKAFYCDWEIVEDGTKLTFWISN